MQMTKRNIRAAGLLVGALLIGVAATMSPGGFKADLLTGNPDQNPLFIDDAYRTPKYSETGAWSNIAKGHAMRERVAAPGKKAKATWSFRNLTPGRYEVWVTWSPDEAAASNARYTVQGLRNKAVTVDQRSAPQAAEDASNAYAGLAWQSLGIHEAQTMLTVELSNDANGRVFADAVLLVALPPPAADLYAQSVSPVELARPGDNVTFLAGIGNAGTETAADTSLTVRLSPGLLADARQPENRCSASADRTQVTCRSARLQNGEKKGYSIAAAVQTDAECGIALAATATTVSGSPYDPNGENNSASAGLNVHCGQLSDLSVNLVPDVSATSPNGRMVFYAVNVTNNGPDALPREASLRIEKLGDDSQNFTLFSGESTPGCNGETCMVPAGLESGQTATVSFIGVFEDVPDDCGKNARTRVSLLPVPEQAGDPRSFNNASEASVMVECSQTADVSVTLDAAAEVVKRNETVTYGISAKNEGPDNASNLQILAKPARDSWFLFDQMDSRCRRLGVSSDVVCTLPSFSPGETVNIDLPAQVSEWADCSGDMQAEAVARATPWDKDNRDNNKDDANIRCE